MIIKIINSFLKNAISAKAKIQNGLKSQDLSLYRNDESVIRNSELRNPSSKLLLQRGFTLIEIIVVIVILSIASGITVYFLINSLRAYTMSVKQKTLLDEAKLALERMCRDIRDAKSITTPAPGGSGNAITFERTNATIGDAVNETLAFQLTGTTLEKVKTSPVIKIPLASNVSSFSVTRGDGGNDEITLLLTLSLGTGENVTLQTKVYPKNLPDTSTYKNFFDNWQEELSS